MAEKTIPDSQIAKRSNEESPAVTREASRYLVPAVDIFETDNGLTLVCDMPGISREQLDIRVVDYILTIRGEASPAREGNLVYREYELLDYFRQFELSDEVDHDNISAELKNGVLTLTLPKSERAKPRQIEVKVS